MTIKAWPDLQKGTGEVTKNLKIFWGKVGELFGDHGFGFLFSPRTSRSKLQNVKIILLGASVRMPPMPFPMPPLFITAVKDICTINTFEKLLNVLFSEVSCWHFGFTTPQFSATTTDMSLYEVLTLFHRWPFVFRLLFFSLTVVVVFNRLHRVYAVWFQIYDFAFFNQEIGIQGFRGFQVFATQSVPKIPLYHTNNIF